MVPNDQHSVFVDDVPSISAFTRKRLEFNGSSLVFLKNEKFDFTDVFGGYTQFFGRCDPTAPSSGQITR